MGNVRKRWSFTDGPILTTETQQAILGRVFVLLFFGMMAAGFSIILPRVRDDPIDQAAVLALGGLQAIFLGTGILITQLPVRGTWFLEVQAVTFKPCHRRSRSLTWSAVERVMWGPSWVILRGLGVQIQIPWEMFPEYQHVSARAFAEARLSLTFDLKDVRFTDSLLSCSAAGRLDKVAAILKLVAIGVGVTIPWAILAFIAALSWQETTWRWIGPTLSLLAVPCLVGLVLYYTIVIQQRELRPIRRIHPEWPWRLPREMSLQLAGKTTDHTTWLDEP